MALFHFHAAQVKRSAGQSAVACTAYRAASKGMTIDLKRVAHAVSYMQTNNIRTLDDLQERIRLAEKATTSVREKSDRMKEIKKIMDCLDSLRQTAYPNYEVIVVDNGSDEPATLELLAARSREGQIRVQRDDSPFNFSALNNRAVHEVLVDARGAGDAVLFARSATAGGQSMPVHWGGDSTSTYVSMAETLRGGLSLAMSGFAFFETRPFARPHSIASARAT